MVQLNYIRVDDFDAQKVFPYQIHLDQDPDDVHVYAPEDDDLFVRSDDDDASSVETTKLPVDERDETLLTMWRMTPAIDSFRQKQRANGDAPRRRRRHRIIADEQ